MSLQDYAKLKGVTHLQQDYISNNLIYSLIDFFNWGFLQIGGFQNISYPATSGVFGGNKAKLRLVDDARYTRGQVWEGFRGNWVWESGIEFDVQPIRTSGVYVGTTFYNTLTTIGQYSHYVDFPRGRVVFNTAIPATSNVYASFSPRYVGFVDADSQFIQKLMFDSNDVSRPDFILSSGNWSEWQDTRIQLPVVGIKALDSAKFAPYQLGGGQYCIQDIVFYIISDNPYDCRQITDIIRSQNDKLIWLLDRAAMKSSNRYPLSLNYQGSPVPSAIQYPELVAESVGYRWNGLYLTNAITMTPNPVNNLFRSVVRFTSEVILENI